MQDLPMSSLTLPPCSPSPHCQYKDVSIDNGLCATVLLENPAGTVNMTAEEADKFAREMSSK